MIKKPLCFITGGSSGLGLELVRIFHDHGFEICRPTRQELDLDRPDDALHFPMPRPDILINCAGHDLGGKTTFLDHGIENIVKILNTNFVSAIVLSHRALVKNANCKIINITSTNNRQYWSNNLAYSLSKKSLAEFGRTLLIDHCQVRILEVQLGLTRTNFNRNRYKDHADRYAEIYDRPCLEAADVAEKIYHAALDDTIKFLEISP